MKPMKKASPGKVIISHHQVIRPSKDYSSAEASYGIQFEVDNTPQAIVDGFRTAEAYVEKRLTRKFKDHMRLLDALARTRSET